MNQTFRVPSGWAPGRAVTAAPDRTTGLREPLRRAGCRPHPVGCPRTSPAGPVSVNERRNEQTNERMSKAAGELLGAEVTVSEAAEGGWVAVGS